LKPHAPGLSESKQKIAEQLAKDQQQRAIMKRLVQEASVLQAPLYVGKSQNLSRRISQHLKGQTDFSKKLVHAVHPSQLIVAYIETKDLMVKAEELMEVLVGITASPRYAKRIG
jgi:predicted GIY-YIG superfamily endonuclease